MCHSLLEQEKEQIAEHYIESVENKEKTGKCLQFALRADFALHVAAVA